MSNANASSDAIIEKLKTIYPAVVADELDVKGYKNQCLPSELRPLTKTQKIAGRIFTARAHAVDAIPAEPYKLELEAVETMVAGDVLVVDAGYDRSCGFWGELLTTACLYKGVNGVVMTACTRDLWKLNDLPFPVYGIGANPADSKGRMDIYEIAKTIEIGGVKIAHGDYISGDEDGLVVIPQDIAAEVVELAAQKVEGENTARKDLEEGVPMGEVFRRYGIL